jgi:hypothetical protein
MPDSERQISHFLSLLDTHTYDTYDMNVKEALLGEGISGGGAWGGRG